MRRNELIEKLEMSKSFGNPEVFVRRYDREHDKTVLVPIDDVVICVSITEDDKINTENNANITIAITSQ